MVPIQSQMNPVHNRPSYFLKIHFSIILRSTPTSPKRSFLSGFPTKTQHGFLFRACDMQSRLMKVLITLYIHLPTAVSSFVCYKYPPQHPLLDHPQPMLFPQCERPYLTSTRHNKQASCNGIIYTPSFIKISQMFQC